MNKTKTYIFSRKRDSFYRNETTGIKKRTSKTLTSESRIFNLKKKSFARTGTKSERKTMHSEQLDIRFSTKDMIHKFEIDSDSKCYLTGDKIDFMDSSSWSADHIIPKSKGGDNSLQNCGLTSFTANQMKSNQTIEELVEMCRKILSLHDNNLGVEDD